MVFFLRPFLLGTLVFRIVESMCITSKLFQNKWNTEKRYQSQSKNPTPRMTKNLFMFYSITSALSASHPTILASIHLEKKEDMLFLVKIDCHYPMVALQHWLNKHCLHLNIQCEYKKRGKLRFNFKSLKNKKRTTKLITVNDSTIIPLSYDTLVTHIG